MQNAPITTASRLYGEGIGGNCGQREVLMTVCSGASGGFVPRGGFTIGNVFVTRQPEVSTTLLSHETKHSDQWAILGLAMPAAYGLAEAASIATGASGAKAGCNNAFKIAAGPEEGGYKC